MTRIVPVDFIAMLERQAGPRSILPDHDLMLAAAHELRRRGAVIDELCTLLDELIDVEGDVQPPSLDWIYRVNTALAQVRRGMRLGNGHG